MKMLTIVVALLGLSLPLAGCIHVDGGAFRGHGSCVYGGVRYTDGSQMCQEGQRMTCRDGRWTATGQTCS